MYFLAAAAAAATTAVAVCISKTQPPFECPPVGSESAFHMGEIFETLPTSGWAEFDVTV